MAKKKASSKKGGASKPKRSVGKNRIGEGVTLIGERQLRSLLASDDNHKGKIDGVVGSLREEIKNAVDKQHLNKKAYAMLKTLHRMKDEALADLWPTLLVYMDMAGVMKRIESVERLPFDKSDEAETEGEVTGNVTPISDGRKTSEAAGEVAVH